MKFTVTIEYPLQVRVSDVEADSQKAAIEQACNQIDLRPTSEAVRRHGDKPHGADWAELAEEPAVYALVDEVGDKENERSGWYFNSPKHGWYAIDPADNSPLPDGDDGQDRDSYSDDQDRKGYAVTAPAEPGSRPSSLVLAARCALADLEGLAQELDIDLDNPDAHPAARTVRELRDALRIDAR